MKEIKGTKRKALWVALVISIVLTLASFSTGLLFAPFLVFILTVFPIISILILPKMIAEEKFNFINNKFKRKLGWIMLIFSIFLTLLSFITGLWFVPVLLFFLTILPAITLLISTQEKTIERPRGITFGTFIKITLTFSLLINLFYFFSLPSDGSYIDLGWVGFGVIILNGILLAIYGVIWAIIFIKRKIASERA